MKKYITLALMLCIAFVSIAKNQNGFKVWKTVTLGSQKKSAAMSQVRTQVGWFWEEGFREIPISEKKKILSLVIVTAKELGFDNKNPYWLECNYEKVLASAKAKGLKPCPQEVALLVWSDLKKYRNIHQDGNQVTVIGTQLLKMKNKRTNYLYDRCLFVTDYNNGESTSCLRLQVMHGGGDYDPVMPNSKVRFIFAR